MFDVDPVVDDDRRDAVDVAVDVDEDARRADETVRRFGADSDAWVATWRRSDTNAAAAESRPPLTGERRTRSPGRVAGPDGSSASRATRSARLRRSAGSSAVVVVDRASSAIERRTDDRESVSVVWGRSTVRRHPGVVHAPGIDEVIDPMRDDSLVFDSGVIDDGEDDRVDDDGDDMDSAGDDVVPLTVVLLHLGSFDDALFDVVLLEVESTADTVDRRTVAFDEPMSTADSFCATADGKVVQSGPVGDDVDRRARSDV